MDNIEEMDFGVQYNAIKYILPYRGKIEIEVDGKVHLYGEKDGQTETVFEISDGVRCTFRENDNDRRSGFEKYGRPVIELFSATISCAATIGGF